MAPISPLLFHFFRSLFFLSVLFPFSFFISFPFPFHPFSYSLFFLSFLFPFSFYIPSTFFSRFIQYLFTLVFFYCSSLSFPLSFHLHPLSDNTISPFVPSLYSRSFLISLLHSIDLSIPFHSISLFPYFSISLTPFHSISLFPFPFYFNFPIDFPPLCFMFLSISCPFLS
jgi:hypothetical protein